MLRTIYVEAGGGGALRTLFWQAPTSLNPHFAVGAKDVEGAGIFYEPLASWEPDGNLVPMLAAEIPNIEKGGVAADCMSVTWKLKTGVQWHDGQPLTADDVIFNWEYASDPATAATTIGVYQDVGMSDGPPYPKRDPLYSISTRFWPFFRPGSSPFDGEERYITKVEDLICDRALSI